MLRRAANFVAKQAPRPKQAPWGLQSAQVPGATGPASAAINNHALSCNCSNCTPGSTRQFVSSSSLQQHPKTCACEACAFGSRRQFVSSTAAAQAADAKQPDTYHVPLGHLKSDLHSTSCHIGLGRRRDLTLRADLSLTTLAGQQKSLGEWFHGKTAVVFGIPDGGAVCVGEHIPGYEKLAAELKKCDIDEVICVMVGEVGDVKAVATKAGSSALTFAADTTGGFSRLLGLDLAAPSDAGPRSQRYAGIIENGILTKLRVEKELGQVTVSGCETVLELLQCKREERLKFAASKAA